MTDLPHDKWMPIVVDRTARLMDQFDVLWTLVRTNLDPELREKVEDYLFTYECGYAYAESRKMAEQAGKLAEWEARRRQEWEDRLAEAVRKVQL